MLIKTQEKTPSHKFINPSNWLTRVHNQYIDDYFMLLWKGVLNLWISGQLRNTTMKDVPIPILRPLLLTSSIV